jgi:hypothetical protein
MSHGSTTLQIMNLYGLLLMKKFRIGNVPQIGPQSDAHYRLQWLPASRVGANSTRVIM